MWHITRRQTTLGLVTLIFVGLLFLLVSNWLQPRNARASQQSAYLVYLLITAVLWAAAWFDWPYIRPLIVALLTVVTTLAIPHAYFVETVPLSVLIPPILALVISGIPSVVISAGLTWGLLLWRAGDQSAFVDPQSISLYVLAVTGLVLGRLVIDAKLAHERDLLEALMNNIPDTIYFKDTASRFTRINLAQAALLGVEHPEAAVGKTDFDFQDNDLSHEFYAEEQEMMATGQSIIDRIEYNPAPDGAPRWLSATKVPIRSKDGRIMGMVGMSHDITERIQMEEALEESARNYRKIFNATNDAIIIHDEKTGAILDVNNRMLEMFGCTYEEALTLAIGDISAEDSNYSQAVADTWLQKARKEGPQVFEWRTRHKSGKLFWAEVALRHTEINGQSRILATVRDITIRKKAEDSLRISEERFSKAFLFSPDSIVISSQQEGRIIEANAGFERLFGYTQQESLGRTAQELNLYAHPQGRERLLAILQTEGEVRDLETKARHKSGELFDILVSAEQINIGGETCLITTVRDITERKKAAAALRAYAAELERSNQDLENFASIASHDLQEPLRKIRAFSDRLLQRYADQLDERAQDYLVRMDNAAVRMQTLIRDLLAFARVSIHDGDFTAVNLSDVAQNAVSDLETRLEETQGQIIIDGLPTIDADQTQMRQLLQNLIGNALKFHRPDVLPVVQIKGEQFIDQDQAQYCRLTVADNGIGFDEAYLPRLFTIFQRLQNREEFEGTGIGLAICRRIAERHGGTITAHSQPGEGATFIITLPVKQQ